MTAQATRKAASRAADEPDDGIIRFSDEPEEPKYDTLFRLGGKEYQVLLNPPASLMLSYFDRVREEGPNLAIAWALSRMVGEDGYSILKTDPRVTREGFRQVVDAAMDILLGNEGGARGPKPSSSRRRKSG
jgi:hypothetical protein